MYDENPFLDVVPRGGLKQQRENLLLLPFPCKMLSRLRSRTQSDSLQIAPFDPVHRPAL
jgi:hypothetical protein